MYDIGGKYTPMMSALLRKDMPAIWHVGYVFCLSSHPCSHPPTQLFIHPLDDPLIHPPTHPPTPNPHRVGVYGKEYWFSTSIESKALSDTEFAFGMAPEATYDLGMVGGWVGGWVERYTHNQKQSKAVVSFTHCIPSHPPHPPTPPK